MSDGGGVVLSFGVLWMYRVFFGLHGWLVRIEDVDFYPDIQ